MMPLDTGYILHDAYRNGYAVPALSVHSKAMIEAVIAEAQMRQMPVMLQIGQRAIRNGQMDSLVSDGEQIAARATIPVVIHLDHSHEYVQVVQAVRAGFTSCMIDASTLPFAENIAVTTQVVQLCHAVHVPVEGELGAIGGVEDDISVREEDVVYTSPGAASEFVRKTQVDSLAVAIGSAHGMYRQTPKLDLQRLQQIRECVSVPLVLHGGSGIPKDQIQSAIRLGISKINFDTELRIAFLRGWREGLERYSDDPFSAEQLAIHHLRELVAEKIEWCRP